MVSHMPQNRRAQEIHERRCAAQRQRRQRERELRSHLTHNVTTNSHSQEIHERQSRGQRIRRQREQALRALNSTDGPNNPGPSTHILVSLDNSSDTPKARLPYHEPATRHDLGLMTFMCSFCGALHWLNEKLASSSLQSPVFTTCCNRGAIALPNLQHPPTPLVRLFTGTSPQSSNFRDHIWEYNRALAFTSLGANEDHSVNNGRGPPVFRIHGELYHHSGSLLPPHGHTPRYAQLYVYDASSALDYRMQNNPSNHIRRDTMEILQGIINNHNQYAKIYLHAFEILQDFPHHDVNIRLRVLPHNDCRHYNLPVSQEVGMILPNDDSIADGRDILLHFREGGLQRISECHPAYSPLQYVLLFPYGENGWYPELEKQTFSTRSRLTLTRFTAYRLHDRPFEFSCLLHGGRLLQRYIVDMWAASEQNDLRFLRQNQSMLRSHISRGLEDAINKADGDVNLANIGQQYILPASHVGSPRYQYQAFQDSLALARHHKIVDLFLTMTCNPNWPEIQQALQPGQSPYDRPDICSRVFRMKKDALLKEIIQDGVLGNVAAYVWVIEFQKRGLPHIHLLLFLQHPHKLFSADEIDKLISARWPDPTTQPLLFETVKSCMIHGPCGAANPNSPCMNRENPRPTCTKHYPKAFSDETTLDEDGFPLYFRPNDGREFDIGNGFKASNQWIVPYCPYLSAKYNYHINLECAVSLKTFKYIFKYIQKGSDRATLELSNRQDEIKHFLDGRYISASEASWRIFHFDIRQQNPPVVRLQVHLPGQDMVVFDPNDDPVEVHEYAVHNQTTLTAFFALNKDNGEDGFIARQLTYQEIPTKFRWITKDNHGSHYWKRCATSSFALGRMYYVPPNCGERFYLRCLLSVVKGPTSYDDLKTVNGYQHATFRDTALALGLLQDDGEWDDCLSEAVSMQTGTQLRQLFVTLLLFCDVTQPDSLWFKYRHSICDNLKHHLASQTMPNPSDNDAYDYGLFLINKLLGQSAGKSLADWPSMPSFEKDWEGVSSNHLLAEQLNYRQDEQLVLLQQRLAMLNEDQLSVYQTVIESVINNDGKLFFLNGPGGTGKTFVYNTICNKLRSEGYVVLAVASSGIAALLICGGRTAHSTFRIPVEELTMSSICAISKNSNRADLLRHTSLIIWDEAVMQHRYAIEAVDRLLRNMRNSDKPFGGVTVLFGGDFQQILPVISHGNREECVNASLSRSYLWFCIRILHLRQNMCLSHTEEDRLFAKWLLEIGHGRHISHDGKMNVPSALVVNNTESLINFIYPYISSNPPPPPSYFQKRMILAPRNVDVEDLNSVILSAMSGSSRTYTSADRIIDEDGAEDHTNDTTLCDSIPDEFLHTINDGNLPPGHLTLKLGCPLILLRNLCPSEGLCNGTRCILRQMHDRLLEVEIIGGDHDGEIALIPRITVTSPSTAAATFRFTRRQFPVRLAFCLTINKSQGQSVDYVGLDLRIPVFSHGQLYVAFSRATSIRRVRILLPASEPYCRVKNVVYNDVLLD